MPRPVESLRSSEIIEGIFSDEQARKETQAHRLDFDGEPFAIFYMGKKHSTISWEGALELDNLHEQVLVHLATDLATAEQCPVDVQAIAAATTVRFLTAEGVKTFELSDPAERHPYGELLEALPQKDSGGIKFVRFDVRPGTAKLPEYSFTAHLFPAADRDVGELAIRRSNSSTFSKRAAAWVVDHHRSTTRPKSAELFAKLQQLISTH